MIERFKINLIFSIALKWLCIVLFVARIHAQNAPKKINEFSAFDATVDHMTYNDDGSKLVTACKTRHEVAVWQGVSGDPLMFSRLYKIPEANNNLGSEAFLFYKFMTVSPDKNWLAFVLPDSSVQILDMHLTEFSRTRFSAHVQILTFSWDLKTVFIRTDEAAYLSDFNNGEIQNLRIISKDPDCYAELFSGDNKLLIGDRYMWTLDGKFLGAFDRLGGFDLVMSPNKKYFTGGAWLWNMDKMIVADMENKKLLHPAYSHDGCYLAGVENYSFRIMDSQYRIIYEYTMPRKKQPGKKNEYVTYTATAFSPDSKYLTLGMSDGTIQIWEMPTSLIMSHNGGIVSLAVCDDGTVISSGGEGNLRWWSKGNFIKQITQVYATDIAVSDKQHIATAGRNGAIHIYDKQGQELTRWGAHTGEVTNVEYMPATDEWISAGSDGAVFAWTSGGKKTRTILPESGDPILSLSVENTTGQIIVSTASGSVYGGGSHEPMKKILTQPVWIPAVQWSREDSYYFSTRTNEVGRAFLGGQADQTKLKGAENIHVFVKAGDRIFAGDTDGNVWRMNGLEREIVYTGSTAVTALSASPDGRVVYAGFMDGLIFKLQK
ncbi:MAG TPA: WD40 repeat domain-containing protein [bacterium]|nr:WD40 repeat domain-containing protein [bacterium]HMW37380.1 WD40 repeat domain-containing protein [bacterium]HMY35990.1 WD40 repeat domain-containing protein [bacterium]HMZ04718.1 WD40 repeat domain-containing protein [bacterium]HNE82597.1 WD40 repeat domain-containing protein [bacterium]